MLKEYKNVQQKKNEPKRRWFSDNYFDLIVWFGEGDEIIGFQLCYEINKDERALTWQKEAGYYHNRVISGESSAGISKLTPILVQDGVFDYDSIAMVFKNESRELEENVADFVYEKIGQYK
ncbi:MAG TPA: hypothetical protein PKZ12_03400 [Smithellaceae bacterium]|nr:hypothetical protein [Smithellaceae bacterium]